MEGVDMHLPECGIHKLWKQLGHIHRTDKLREFENMVETSTTCLHEKLIPQWSKLDRFYIPTSLEC